MRDGNKEMLNPVLARWAAVRPAGPAIYSESGEVLRSGEDLEREASGFLSRLGGDVGAVALQVGNHASFPALLLAAWQAGRAVCLYDADLRGGLRDGLDAELGVTLRVSGEGGHLQFQQGMGEAPASPPEDLYKLTSGTVSRPQALGFSAARLLADCDQVCTSMGLGAGDVNFGVISFAHSYGFSNLITPLLCRGLPLVVAADPLPRAIASGLAASRATVLPAVPAMFRALLSCDGLPASLRLCISAGAPLDPALARDFHAKFGRKIHSFYGASECGGICYDRSDDPAVPPGFVGPPLDGVTVEPVDPSQPSRIRVRSAAFGDGSFEPSDLLVREAGGFRIVGRESDVLNVGGRKTRPEEIEAVLSGCPGVRAAVVCGVADPGRGHELCALIAGTATPAVLRRHCGKILPNWKIPRRFVLVEEIPVTPRGKISRAAIAREYFR